MFQTKVVEKIKTHSIFSVTVFFFFYRKHAVYDIVWKYVVDPDRPQMTI
jgi:hypothetical protein